MPETFRVSVVGGIDAVTDLAKSDQQHVLYMENLDVRSGTARPMNLPLLNPNIVIPDGTVQIYSYRGRLLLNGKGRRSYAAEFMDGRDRIYWTQYGGNAQKMILGVTVPLGQNPPAMPTVTTGEAISPENVLLTVEPSTGTLTQGTTVSFRLAYNTAQGIFPASGAVTTTIQTAGSAIKLTWSNPTLPIPVSETWIFAGNGTGNEKFLVAVGAKASEFLYATAQGTSGASAAAYDQNYNYQYCLTYLREVNGVQDESGPSSPTPPYESILSRSVAFDPWSEGLMNSPNLVTWGSGQPGFQFIAAANLPGSGVANALSVTSITQDSRGQIIATFTTPHAFCDGEWIFIKGLSPDPFANQTFPGVANYAAVTGYANPTNNLILHELDNNTFWQYQTNTWVDITSTGVGSLPVQIQVDDAASAGVGMFNSVKLLVGNSFSIPGTGLVGVTAYRETTANIQSMAFNPSTGALDVYPSTPHTFGTERVVFAGITDKAWIDPLGVMVIGDPGDCLRFFVEGMTLPQDQTDFTSATVKKMLTGLEYVNAGEIDYSSTAETQYGQNTQVTYATVTSGGVTGLTGPQGYGVNEQITYTLSGATAPLPILGDVLYVNMTTTEAVKVPVYVRGVPAMGLLLTTLIPGAGDTSGPVYTSGIQFIPHNDYIIKRRLYRTGGTPVFQLVAELDLDTVTYADAIPDSGLGDALPTLFTSDDIEVVVAPPPFGLTGLVIHYGMGFAWDPSNNRLRVSLQGNLDAWPEDLYWDFDYRILCLLSYNHNLYVFTEDGVYYMSGTTPTTLQKFRSKAAGCRAGGSVQIVGNTVIYLIDQGLAAFDGQNSLPLTNLKIPPEFWLANSGYASGTDPGQFLVPFAQNAAYPRLAGNNLPAVPPDLMPYMTQADLYMAVQQSIRSFDLYGKYFLYWGADFPFFPASTMISIDFSAPESPIVVMGIKAVDIYKDEINRVHMLLNGVSAVGGGGAPLESVSVTLNTTSIALNVGEEVSLMATVSSNSSVVWSVDGVAGGNASVGTITPDPTNATHGVYTAGTAVGNHTITATSTVNGAVSASCVVSVTVPSSVSVALSPASLSLSAGQAASLNAAVAGTSNMGLTWTVDGVAGGNSSVGTIVGSGLNATYTAPAAAGSHTITATSTADPTKSASSTAAVTTSTGVSVNVSPSTVTVNQGSATTFTANVTGSTNTAVTWTVDGVSGGNSIVGTISGTGVYTAPATAGSHTIVATSVADGSKTASATVTVSAVTMSISPASPTVGVNAAFSLTATVNGTINTGVTWKVDGVSAGNSTTGAVTGTGNSVTYTSPASAGTHTITATSVANTGVSASSSVVVTAPGIGGNVSLSAVGPLAAGAMRLNINGCTILTSTVTGSSNPTTWQIDGHAITLDATGLGGDPSYGYIYNPINDPRRVVYYAPASTGSHTVTATCAGGSASIVFNIQPTIIDYTTWEANAIDPTQAPYNWVGDGSSGDRTKIDNALAAAASAGKAVVIPNPNGPGGTKTYTVLTNTGNDAISNSGIAIPSNTVLLIKPGVVIQAQTTDTNLDYAVLNIANASNVQVYGYGNAQSSVPAFRGGMTNFNAPPTGIATILGNWAGETSTPGEEAGDCVIIKNGNGVVIEGLYCTNAYNDGITSTASGSGDSTNVMVANCICTACHRDPMSIVEANNVVYQNNIGSWGAGTLEGGKIVNGLGLDIEPNSTNYNGSSYGVCYNILIAKNDYSNNYWCGIAFGVGNSPSGTWNIWIDQNKVVNSSAPALIGIDSEYASNSYITRNIVYGAKQYGIHIHNSSSNNLVQGNNVAGVAGPGILLEEGDSHTVVNANTSGLGAVSAYPSATNSGWGIQSSGSASPTVTNNKCDGNGSGSISVTGYSGTYTNSGNT